MKTRLTLILSAVALTFFCPAYAQNLFISWDDYSSSQAGAVDEYTQSGEFVRRFIPEGSGDLNQPYNLRFGPNGNLFVTSTHDDFAAHPESVAIKEYDGKTGAFIRDVYHTPSRGAGDFLFDSQGNLYVPVANEVLKIDPTNGALLRTYDVPGAWSLAFLPDGNLVVSGGLSLTKLDVTTGTTSLFGTLHHEQRSIMAGPDGRYYITEPLGLGGNTIEVVGPEGGEAVPWSKGGEVGYFGVFSNGKLFVTGTNGIHSGNIFDAATGDYLFGFGDTPHTIGIALGPLGSPVPEPGTRLVFAIGLVSMFWLLRRRKRLSL